MQKEIKLPSEEIQRLLKTVIEHFSKEDIGVRERQLLTARRMKLLWDNLTNVWFSEVAHDWKVFDTAAYNEDDGFQAYYDKPVNVFRAYLESIIAALSVTVPPVTCYPEDAENNLDLLTAKTGDKIAEIIYRRNNHSLQWLKGLFIWCTEGMIAAHIDKREDYKYGKYEKKIKEYTNREYTNLVCPECEFIFEENTEPIDIETLEMEICPNCGAEIIPVNKTEVEEEEIIKDIKFLPKSSVETGVYGCLNVKVANYARTQAETPYLIYSYECHYSEAIERYSHLYGKKSLTAKKIRNSIGPKDPYEAWARVSTQYRGDYPENVVTERYIWLRPWSYNVLETEEKVEQLRRKYPDGVKVCLVNDEIGDVIPEKLDDHWELSYNPLADYLSHDPLGLLLTSVQEITNDLISLTLQTIEHGIPQTFADPQVLNFKGYSQSPSTPGGIYEAKPKSGQRLGDAFHEVKTATLSAEVLPFAGNIQSLGQLVSGALPSLFGGQLEGSETASEYSMSRSQALQRLQNTWKVLCSWWKGVYGKAIPLYIECIVEDEKDVRKNRDGNFINVLIRKADLEGKIARVEIEANENLPMTWGQRKDVVMALLTSGNPELMKAIMSPQNLPFIREAIGLTDLYIPDEDDRNKQYEEIQLLLQGQPILEPDYDEVTGTEEVLEFPSVEVEEIDNHLIHYQICRDWAISDIGRETKVLNPEGYKNVLLHAKMHMAMIQEMIPQNTAPVDEKGAPPAEKPSKLSGKEAPITGDSNVETV